MLWRITSYLNIHADKSTEEQESELRYLTDISESQFYNVSRVCNM